MDVFVDKIRNILNSYKTDNYELVC